jgi:hypothetical protein
MTNLFTFWRRGAPLDAQAQQQARIDAKLRAIERQGAGSVVFAHGLAYLLVIAFSAGSLIALAGDALRTFIAQAQHGVLDVPSLISFIVSFALVFAMDTSMVIAAATVRMLRQRHQDGLALHVAMIAGVCLVESATYLYMSYVYDHPVGWVAWTILTARAVSAPIVAVYLSLARTLPISARDINTQVEAVTGRGVLVDMTRIADDPAATTERKVALYRASAIMDETDAGRLDAIIQAERSTRTAGTAADALPVGTVEADHTPTLPTPPTTPERPARRLSPREERRLQLERDMRGERMGVRAHPTSPGWRGYDTDEDGDASALNTAEDASADAADEFDMDYEERPQRVTRPKPRAVAKRDASAAHIPRMFGELTIDLPEGKTARKGDSPEARKVMNYLDKHHGATIVDVMSGARVSRSTARRYYTAWIERNKRQDVAVAPFTEEMPAITADMLTPSTANQAQ